MTQRTLALNLKPSVMKQAKAVYSECGLTMAEACQIFITKTAKKKAFPFKIDIPNRDTIKAIEELEAGKGVRVSSLEELYKDLGI
ncbi:MAG: type II toxin-antitoxin system RelB/DinJ family antitoxin [Deltaproteobacteria bacterium]|jgi:DNA-damage-inducible protein J|nr:type II toxin-antitoxin system RelB/DinJ family antitoxin [Deltaproteobacteria bacterium]